MTNHIFLLEELHQLTSESSIRAFADENKARSAYLQRRLEILHEINIEGSAEFKECVEDNHIFESKDHIWFDAQLFQGSESDIALRLENIEVE